MRLDKVFMYVIAYHMSLAPTSMTRGAFYSGNGKADLAVKMFIIEIDHIVRS